MKEVSPRKRKINIYHFILKRELYFMMEFMALPLVE